MKKYPVPKATKVIKTTPKYRILVDMNDNHIKGIQCLTCGKTSWNGNDIEYEYCAACKKFHNDESAAEIKKFYWTKGNKK